ncbi:DegT/DnrJ/EryC1/StrS aminotransferase family protein [Phenylobacterium sp.]|uniref:DegT/DnrJ/EryC1/StrS family aminotransferase n=1 Tax=Phenylobacterium sp. TaxID=1871053 RepID=UPI002736F81A|nr:DegT/DnrJ/EryC1/StrS family aminotransferase [Phenylobacterium sp.]MDP3855267.1 DegT/DnrJ/EryC1/StrS family aminotransferase [Phenylobacterium sp.]
MARTNPAVAQPPASGTAAKPWDLARAPRIPVARPRLVELSAALPYLRAIDASRTYSNFGPLNAQFETRLAAQFGLEPGHVATCNNATSGLTMALQRAAGRGGRYCLMPAWTFAATAHAALAAGLTPYLVDVDPTTWAVTPQIALEALPRISHGVAAIVPVAPFGLPLDAQAWDAFQAQTGVEVVLDAAAGFDGLQVGRAAAVVSLHATKILGIGEGGFVASRDAELIVDVRRRSNFGFDGSRDSSLIGCNGKLSEFGAAYGLAALDHWRLQRAQYQSVLGYYRASLADTPDLKIAPGLGDDWMASTFNIEAPEAAILEIETRLSEAEIATRRWWGHGLQGHQAFADLPRAALPVTERLAATTLGLPCWPGLDTTAIDEISAIVRAVLQR